MLLQKYQQYTINIVVGIYCTYNISLIVVVVVLTILVLYLWYSEKKEKRKKIEPNPFIFITYYPFYTISKRISIRVSAPIAYHKNEVPRRVVSQDSSPGKRPQAHPLTKPLHSCIPIIRNFLCLFLSQSLFSLAVAHIIHLFPPCSSFPSFITIFLLSYSLRQLFSL